MKRSLVHLIFLVVLVIFTFISSEKRAEATFASPYYANFSWWGMQNPYVTGQIAYNPYIAASYQNAILAQLQYTNPYLFGAYPYWQNSYLWSVNSWGYRYPYYSHPDAIGGCFPSPFVPWAAAY